MKGNACEFAQLDAVARTLNAGWQPSDPVTGNGMTNDWNEVYGIQCFRPHDATLTLPCAVRDAVLGRQYVLDGAK